MMDGVHIVTDSFTLLGVLPRDAPITVVPNRLVLGSSSYREGVDLANDELFQKIATGPHTTVQPPTTAEYVQVYHRLAREARAIISVHASREMFSSWQHARYAVEQVGGNCPIFVLDSRTLSAGQALLIKLAVRLLADMNQVDDVVRELRGAVERIYSIFYVDSLETLMNNRILEPAHAMLGTMLGIKPVLTIENGRLSAMEKVKTRAQAIERMVEFAVEFLDIEDGIIIQSKKSLAEPARILQERLAAEFRGYAFPHSMYGPSLAALIGTDATGLVVLEKPVPDDIQVNENDHF